MQSLLLTGLCRWQVIVEPTLDGEPTAPQQAMLMLTAPTGTRVYLLCKGSKREPTKLKGAVTAAAVEKQIGKQVCLGLVVGGPAFPLTLCSHCLVCCWRRLRNVSVGLGLTTS